MLLGAAASAVVLWRRFGASLPVLTLLRVSAATAATFAIARILPVAGKALTVMEAGVCGAVFLGTLVVTGELGRGDLAALRRRK
jgi:hypothetical protein